MNTPTNAAMRPSDASIALAVNRLSKLNWAGSSADDLFARIFNHAAHEEVKARELDAAQPVLKDREKDRKWFLDPAFNRWLDEGISDAGHTVYDTIGSLYDAWLAWQAAPYYCAAQPAQAGEAVYQVKFRAQGSGWVTVDRESYESPLAYLPEHYERRVAYLHPQPEQPASAKCGCGLATCVEPWEPGCGLGTSKEHAVRVDEQPASAVCTCPQFGCPAHTFTHSPAVSLPSVVAVSEEDALLPCPFCGGEAHVVEGDECAFVQCRQVKMHRALWVDGDNNAAGEAREQWNRRAALESFASRIAGSGERDAERYRRIFNDPEDSFTLIYHVDRDADRVLMGKGDADAYLDAAIAQQNKRGDQK
jgi:hypothetical protein